CQQYTSLPWTF
nr:immunoglobulin light chain junction region [Macaca mulatta]